MNNLLMAIQVLNALLTLGIRSGEAVERVSTLINDAVQEDRDLTDEEVAEVHDWRAEAMARWDAVK